MLEKQKEIFKETFFPITKETVRKNWTRDFYAFIENYKENSEMKALADANITLLKAEIEYYRIAKTFSDKECDHFLMWIKKEVKK